MSPLKEQEDQQQQQQQQGRQQQSTSRYIEKAINEQLVKDERQIYKIHKWNYADVANFLKCDPDFAPLIKEVKDREISGQLFLDLLEAGNIPLWGQHLSPFVWTKWKLIRDEIVDVITGPPPLKKESKKNPNPDESPTSSSDLELNRHHHPKRSSLQSSRRRSSLGKAQRRSSVESYLDSDGEGPIDRFVKKTSNADDDEDDEHEDEDETTAVNGGKAWRKLTTAQVLSRARPGSKSAKASSLQSAKPQQPVAILSYSSGENKKEFKEWIEMSINDLNRTKKGVAWEVPSDDAKTGGGKKGKRNNEVIQFVSEPKQLEKVKYLVVHKLQEKPTLKILYALASNNFIFTESFIKHAVKKSVWPDPRRFEHPSWPSVDERVERGQPLKPLRIGVFGDFEKPSMSKSDIVQLIRLGGGEVQMTRSLIGSTLDVIIVSDGLNAADTKYLQTRILKSGEGELASAPRPKQPTKTSSSSSSLALKCLNRYCKIKLQEQIEEGEKAAAGSRSKRQVEQTVMAHQKPHPPHAVGVAWLVESLRNYAVQDVLQFVKVIGGKNKRKMVDESVDSNVELRETSSIDASEVQKKKKRKIGNEKEANGVRAGDKADADNDADEVVDADKEVDIFDIDAKDETSKRLDIEPKSTEAEDEENGENDENNARRRIVSAKKTHKGLLLKNKTSKKLSQNYD